MGLNSRSKRMSNCHLRRTLAIANEDGSYIETGFWSGTCGSQNLLRSFKKSTSLKGSLCLPLEWRLRVLSVPTLVQRICETCTTNTAAAAIDGTFTATSDSAGDKFTFSHSGSGALLLYRLDVLNNITLSSRAQPNFAGNMQLFVPSVRMKSVQTSSLSKPFFSKREELNDLDALMHVQIASAFEMDGKPCWSVIDGILQLLESEERAKLARLKHYERIYTFFVQIFAYFSPSSGEFIISPQSDRFPVIIFSRCLTVIIPYCSTDPHFEELVTGFLADFVDLISTEGSSDFKKIELCFAVCQRK
ncbi:unnamed protein product [Enterobius vermicularis]|uniref:DUF3480 domain-containing protein n=1 Tax=Enterobius vermicularis TaxID=51028 RepID=A0A0N4VMM8_ENTVE|nr:unnamed protein product [Enterobius vermicularis]